MEEKKEKADLIEEKFIFYYVPNNDSVSINDPVVFYELVNSLPADKKFNIHLIIHTLGGNPYAAAKIVNILQQRFEKLTIVVPYWAMSAGTLIALGGDKIVMSGMSQLGPLDMQVEHPVSEKRMSAYDYINNVSYIVGLVDTTKAKFFKKAREESNNAINSCEAMKIAFDSSVKLFEPIVKQLDPVELSRCSRILEVAQRYGKDFLLKHSLRKDYRKSEYADVLIGYFTNGFPNHSYGINYEELGGFGINIENDKEYEYWKEIWDVASPFILDDLQGGVTQKQITFLNLKEKGKNELSNIA